MKWKRWFEQKGKEPSKAETAFTHIKVFFARSLSLGRGATMWTKFALMRGGMKENLLGPERDGFKAMKGDGTMDEPAREEYMARYAERQREPAKVGPMNRYGSESLLRTAARVRKLGARPYVLLAPTTSGLRGRPSEKGGLPIFDFCDMETYPELFEPRHRADIAHLNAAGAEIFTQRVAEKFLAEQKSEPAPNSNR
jgi:hypothetical protein